MKLRCPSPKGEEYRNLGGAGREGTAGKVVWENLSQLGAVAAHGE